MKSDDIKVEQGEKLKIGCTSLVLLDFNKIVAIKCSKGRGYILPGGKYEPKKDKSFTETAIRELFEETGLKPTHTQYAWGGLNTDDYYVYTYKQIGCDMSKLKSSSEGEAVVIDINQLREGQFWPYYEVLFQVIGINF